MISGYIKRLRHCFIMMCIKLPITRHFSQYWYKRLGVNTVGNDGCFHISIITVVGSYENIYLHNHAEINRGCFLLAKDRIEIGENSTIAYGATILTSANPNGPYNQLAKIYPAMHAPVIIGNNVWIGSNAIILPGVTIGDMSVVAAGSVVTKDIPKGVLVAGNPAVIKKKLI